MIRRSLNQTTSLCNATIILALLVFLSPILSQAQLNWNKDGNSYTSIENNSIVETTLPALTKTTLVSAEQLAPLGLPASDQRTNNRGGSELHYQFSDDQQKVLLFTNPHHLYHNTFYSCQVLDRKTNQLIPIATKLPPSSLLNAKLSPDGTKLAFVYDNNLWLEDLSTQTLTALTTDGNDRLLNGWFDYAYSEELYTIDGFRWSPDSKKIAYWQMNLAKVGTFYMINNTDSIYPRIIAIPFPKVGEPIAEARVGVLSLDTKSTQWMSIDGDPASHYLPRMEWTPDGSHLIVQQLNRAQNNSKLMLCNPADGASKTIYDETDDAWIDIKAFWSHSGGIGWDWLDNGKAFLWASEKDGWRHLYKVTLDGQETLLTKGNYDVTSINGWDEQKGILYFGASPDNATQRYLYSVPLNTSGKAAARVTPEGLPGTHAYLFSPNGRWAQHSFSSHLYAPASEWLSMPANQPIGNETIATSLKALRQRHTHQLLPAHYRRRYNDGRLGHQTR